MKLPALLGSYATAIMTDRPTDDRRTDRVIGKLHFTTNKKNKEIKDKVCFGVWPRLLKDLDLSLEKDSSTLQEKCYYLLFSETRINLW